MQRVVISILAGLLAAACATTGPDRGAPGGGGSTQRGASVDRVRWLSVFHEGVPADSLVTPAGGSRCSPGGLPDSVALVGPPRFHADVDTLDVRVAGLFCSAEGLPARILLEHGGRSISLPIHLHPSENVHRALDFIQVRGPGGSLERLGYVRDRRRFYPESALRSLDSGDPMR